MTFLKLFQMNLLLNGIGIKALTLTLSQGERVRVRAFLKDRTKKLQI
jgi:primosomal replication protein N